MTSKALVSVIVPVYNTEKYLKECAHSILSQSYDNLELILVEDGSSDGSLLLCKQIASSDNRVKITNKPNGGLSETRNIGLTLSKGKYIIFLDSDDFWISNNSLDLLVAQIERNNFDFLCFNCCYFYPSVNRYIPWKAFNNELLENTDKNRAIVNLVRSGTFPMSACLKIVNRSFLIENQISFRKGVFSEDIPWFLELIRKSNSFGFIDQYVYAYRKEVSTSITSTISEKKYNDLLEILKTELNKISEDSWVIDVKRALFSFLAYEYCILLGLASLLPYNTRKMKLKELNQYIWLLNYNLNPKVLKVYVIQRILGLNITSHFLKLYLKYYLGTQKKHNI